MNWLISAVLNWAWAKLSAWALALYQMVQRRKEIAKQEEESVEPLKKANPESEKEIDDATHDALDGL